MKECKTCGGLKATEPIETIAGTPCSCTIPTPVREENLKPSKEHRTTAINFIGRVCNKLERLGVDLSSSFYETLDLELAELLSSHTASVWKRAIESVPKREIGHDHWETEGYKRGWNEARIALLLASRESAAAYAGAMSVVKALEPYSSKYRRYLKDAKVRSDLVEMSEFANKDIAADEMLSAAKKAAENLKPNEGTK